ncbi:MAG: alpha/beta hydrolase [Planctomycetia bacterium]|nr:alpha/beta hydrolase [Planctomycetia bacterium]
MTQFVLCAAVSGLLTGCAGLSGGESSWSRFEREHVFVAAKYPEGNWKPAAYTFEDVWFHTADGTRLNGWYAPCENPAAVVLLAHGNAGNVTNVAPLLKRLRDQHHVSVLAFDYRGYGKSEGRPDEPGILEDARAARSWLAKRANVDERDIVLMGQSLGGGVAVNLAAHDGARGLVLISTFTSLPDVAGHHWPIVPAGWFMHNRLESISKIDKYDGPLLQVHGDKDRIIPIGQGEKLFARAHEPKRFVVSHGADHNDPLPVEFDGALDEFLASLRPAKVLPQPKRWHAAGAGG